MTVLQHIPAIIRVLIVFIFFLFLIRKKLSLGNAFLLVAILFSVLFGLHPRAMIGSMAESIVYPKTLSLALIVSLILILSSSMELSGQMKRLLGKFKGLIKNIRINLIVFPALIGLLPMPGGAIFSAPMVKDLGMQSELSGDKLSFINYWFRHIWEYCWPWFAVSQACSFPLFIFVLFFLTNILMPVWGLYTSIYGCCVYSLRLQV